MSALTAALEVRRAARAPWSGGPDTRAAVTLDRMHRLMPFDAAALSRWDPVRRVHTTVAATGYDAAVTGFLDRQLHRLPLFRVPLRTGEPVRIRDLPAGRRRGPVFDEVIEPSGFAEGVTLCLFDATRRYVGMLNASFYDTRGPDDERTTLLALLAGDLAATVVTPLRAVPRDGGMPAARLTARELDVLRLVAAGLSNPAIAEALGLRPRTVATHIEHVLGRLDVTSRAAAVAAAARLGVLDG